jgi:heterodisulfide reductase subunit A-like polyferredoxin
LARVLIVGGGITGMQAALKLSQRGTETFLVERGTELGGVVNPFRGEPPIQGISYNSPGREKD